MTSAPTLHGDQLVAPAPAATDLERRGRWWLVASFLACPCHLPITLGVLGAVHQPAWGQTFVGGPLLPSTRNGDRLEPLADRPLGESCATTYLHPPFYDGEVGAAFARAVRGVATLRMMGSGTMDAVAIAQGRCDVLFQHSVPDWDRLPGAAIVRGVGGESRVDHRTRLVDAAVHG